MKIKGLGIKNGGSEYLLVIAYVTDLRSNTESI